MLLEGSDIFEPEEDIGNGLHQIFIAIPLLSEIRCLLDFCMTKTTLDAFQTFQLFQYHSDFYIAKVCNRWYNMKELGTEPTLISKIIGFAITICIVLATLVLPFFLFSATTTQLNPVISAELEVNLQFNFSAPSPLNHSLLQPQTVSFPLYQSNHLLVYNYTQEMFEMRRFDQIPESKFFEPGQLQDVVASRASDMNWQASDAARRDFLKYACSALPGQGAGLEVCSAFNASALGSASVGFEMKTTFVRAEPETREKAVNSMTKVLNMTKVADMLALKSFGSSLPSRCEPGQETQIVLTDFIIPKFLAGQTSEATPLLFETSQTIDQALEDVVLIHQCPNQWSVTTLDGDALTFTVFSQKIKISFLAEYSIFTLYITVIFGYIKIREMLAWHSSKAFIMEVTHPDPILRLCESIYLSRSRGNMRAEDENFRLLSDIVRSPELLHQLTGSRMKRGDDDRPKEAPSD